MNTKQAMTSGLKGAAAIGAWAMMHRLGVSRLSMPTYEGSMLTGTTQGMSTKAAGMGMHLLLSALIAIPYAKALDQEAVPRPIETGLKLGLLHWLIGGMMLPGMDAMNGCVKRGQVPALKVFAGGYGQGRC
ncbi:hypothetical protein [Deinococcus peraridilitoris]|uniref:Uncharacterized protein n=1 Tax=Deinococcus peraridilitoris (strain DSM 19664 / LMG 22246 / CIP 109416 / KR-200) TaxID=937777 RepID=L0A8A0_DEIPD|nr:hypothetical protein [Deinococcus peraridilitoris]AFZ69300.1 hypothetical protein Deipe_3885 [Deinococcus peraridilitoris DSM 19664]